MTMITFETNDNLGYYLVGEEKFHHKVMALIRATETNHFPEWHFNRDEFGRLDWFVEPETSLKELYRIRAQQLRDRYDYIRLEFSGGADSTMVLYSFLNNGIHLDEIVTRWPKAGQQHIPADPFNTTPENTMSEWTYACKPMLQWIQTYSPRTKITIVDFSDDMLLGKHDESWIYRTKEWLLPCYPFKTAVDSTVEHKKTLDSGKSVCVLWGVDKPKLCIKDQKWYLYFMDMQANDSSPDTGAYTNMTNEFFYWSADLPELVCKQAHIVKNWFNQPINQHLQHLVRWPNYSITQRAAFESLVKPLIFPDYDPTTFQVGKTTSNFYNEMDAWFFPNFKDSEYLKAWNAGIKYLVNKIDPKYFNYDIGVPTGFVGFIGSFYELGPAVYKSNGINDHFRF
jgi:hypothetical protein